MMVSKSKCNLGRVFVLKSISVVEKWKIVEIPLKEKNVYGHYYLYESLWAKFIFKSYTVWMIEQNVSKQFDQF